MSSQQLLPRIDPEEEALRLERRGARLLRRKQQQRARLILWGSIGSTIVLLGLAGFFFLHIQAILAINTAYPSINGVSCQSMEQNGYHIHAHLTIYIKAKRVTIPQGIGIAPDGSCYYWLHTHTDDGIIHIEAPQKQSNLALDDFLTIWHAGFARLNFPPELLQSTGWQIFINGKPFDGIVTSPLNTEVPLNSHAAITLEYGSPNPPPDIIYAFPPDLPQ